jgi:hypothetical protein
VRWGSVLLICVIAAAAAFAVISGTGGKAEADGDDSSAETTQQANYGMAGAPQDVVISREALESTPSAWVLESPESAVRSYLDWISYGYRTAQPAFAEPTMGAEEAVRVDSYNEYNLQKERIIDQELVEITFGEATIDGATATIGTSEVWTYRYVSTTEPGKTIEGPFEARYEGVYTLAQTDAGWVVDSVDIERLDDSQ